MVSNSGINIKQVSVTIGHWMVIELFLPDQVTLQYYLLLSFTDMTLFDTSP